jgi:hypothetical protein
LFFSGCAALKPISKLHNIVDAHRFFSRGIAQKMASRMRSTFVSFVIPGSGGTPASSSRSNVSTMHVPFHVPEVLTEFERDKIILLVENTLPSMPHDTVRSLKYLKLIHRKVFSQQYREELGLIGRRTLLRRILYACVVRQVIINGHIPLPTIEHLHEMPFYEDKNLIPTSELEIDSLRHFMRAIQTMHEIGVPAVNNKQTYVEVAAMLDDSKCTYALGGAPSRATMRRLSIYHGVTGTEIPPCNTTAHKSKRRKVTVKEEKVPVPSTTTASAWSSHEIDEELILFDDQSH